MKRNTTLVLITTMLFLVTTTSYHVGKSFYSAKTIPNIILGFITICILIVLFYYLIVALRYVYYKIKNLFR